METFYDLRFQIFSPTSKLKGGTHTKYAVDFKLKNEALTVIPEVQEATHREMPGPSAGTAGIGLILQEDHGNFIVKQLVEVNTPTDDVRSYVVCVGGGYVGCVCLCNTYTCTHTHVLQGGSAEDSGKISPGDRIKEVRGLCRAHKMGSGKSAEVGCL